MKNTGKKSRRVKIECVSDLMDALIDLEMKANDQLADLGVKSAVKVEEGVGFVNIKLDDRVVFSMKVTDESASSAFGALRDAIDRAKKEVTPKAEEAEVLVDDLPANEKAVRNDMTEEKFRGELERLAEMANERLVEHLGDKIDDVVINFTFDGGDTVVRSGQNELVTLHGHAWGAVKKAKAIVWPKVDALKSGKGSYSPKTEKPTRCESFAERLDEIVKSANEKLAELGEPPISVDSDSVGVYLKAGDIPLCSLPKGVGSADEALDKAKTQVRKFVDTARGVVDRRKRNVERAKDLESDSAWDVAILKQANPAMEVEEDELWKLGPNAEAAATIVEAAKKSIRAFNASLRFRFDEVSALIGPDAMKLSLKGFTRGIVVSFGTEPCFISMFPLVTNNAEVEETAMYVGATIEAMGKTRMEYYERVSKECGRQAQMRELAAKKDALEGEIAAMAM